jgi:hypothetical protein
VKQEKQKAKKEIRLICVCHFVPLWESHPTKSFQISKLLVPLHLIMVTISYFFLPEEHKKESLGKSNEGIQTVLAPVDLP